MLFISHTTSVGMTLTLVSFFLISHTTSVGMTLTLVSFFLIIILATKLSRYNSRTTSHRAMKLPG